MDDRGVVYMLQGDRHWAVLLVSIYSLRKISRIPICIACVDKPSLQMGLKLANAFPNISTIVLEDTIQGVKNAGYSNKPLVISQSPFRETIFLDADTIVCNDSFEKLFEIEQPLGVTWFSNWTTDGSIMQGRVRKWAGCEPERAARSLQAMFPALNTGVFSFSQRSLEIGQKWLEVTRSNISFMCDEIAMQLLLPELFDDNLAFVFSDHFNWSPLYSTSENPCIVHFHGRKALHEKAINLWLPRFRECWEKDLAGVRQWAPAGDKRLRERMKELGFVA